MSFLETCYDLDLLLKNEVSYIIFFGLFWWYKNLYINIEKWFSLFSFYHNISMWSFENQWMADLEMDVVYILWTLCSKCKYLFFAQCTFESLLCSLH